MRKVAIAAVSKSCHPIFNSIYHLLNLLKPCQEMTIFRHIEREEILLKDWQAFS